MANTLKELLRQGREQLATSSGSAALDAEVLLCHVLDVNRAHLIANPERCIAEPLKAAYAELIGKRAKGVPVAHLTGMREFWSLPLKVGPDVLVPRPETELLVEQALRHLPSESNARILDLGTGSGAIAIAIAVERPACEVTATDQSAAALEVARANAEQHCPARIAFAEGFWFAPVERQKFDLIVSNPPYVATDQPELTGPELAFEPAAALYSGADGLDDLRTLISEAPCYLYAGGWLLVEHGFDQAEPVQQLFAAAGFSSIGTHQDLAGQDRVTCGCMRE